MLRYLPFLLLLTACFADEVEEDLARDPYFDLTAYINRQVDSLQAAGGEVTKTITLNGTTETKRMTDLNFATDLRVFREADINKPAWLDKYHSEREARGDSLIRTYTALDSSMQTRRLRVVSQDNVPVHIEIIRRTGTVLSKGQHRLIYEPARGYRMRTEQTNRFGKDLDADIAVSW
ncbi:hypothetical protein CLV84_1220 [Neolewinella xylanilytica]|uniref:Uncharacterized protein n=1 Tax=Neolewinella xylanilytica TaxID=1514080 RepID=A0A2S6I9S8_9BACT|nr:hypothetical protein [Neolewinella xylanilytica]PPK88255.1 hypothetical protein CLV84_1220 [Neolewinella xylanilytica]